MLESLAPEGDKSGKGQQETRAVPSYLVQTVKLARDLGNGGRNNTLEGTHLIS